MTFSISADFIAAHNAKAQAAHDEDYAHLTRQLERRGIAIEDIVTRVMDYAVAVPTWGVGTGGTRFARFPGPGEPRNIHDKLEDCGVINQLTRHTPNVSPHFPWDKVSDYRALKQEASQYQLGFDAVNSNTFQDQSQQKLSYKFGSLTHADKATRMQAVEHNIECIEIGQQLGSQALTVWIADGSNFAGQSNLTRVFDNYLESLRSIYNALPKNWLVFLEHKMYEPAFYSTVISDWGSSFMAAMELGDKAKCLVDLGHHAPNTNIEQIVARLVHAKKLAGFHFNDSKYGDDDLDSGSVDPFRLFLVFNELVDAEHRKARFPVRLQLHLVDRLPAVEAAAGRHLPRDGAATCRIVTLPRQPGSVSSRCAKAPTRSRIPLVKSQRSTPTPRRTLSRMPKRRRILAAHSEAFGSCMSQRGGHSIEIGYGAT